MSITKDTLEKQAYLTLRARIMSGVLPVGQRLLPKDLAADLDISQTPIKGAMALLQRDGLIEGLDRHGAVVRRFSPVDVDHLYAARRLLELDAVATGVAAGRVDAAFIAAMQDLFKQQIAYARKGTQAATAEVVRLDREFHELIASLSGNPVLMDWHRTLMQQTHTLRVYSLQDYKFERARIEHQNIIDAFRQGDTAAIVAVLQAHLSESRADMRQRMARLEAAAVPV